MTEIAKKSKNKRKLDVVFTAILVALILFVIFLTRFWVSLSLVDGDSMNSTLQNGDILITNNLKTPERFDIVVFKHEENENYIKRVIALEGDVIYNADNSTILAVASIVTHNEILVFFKFAIEL